jgi:DNA-directed RNA polymerase specialized sigma24 family protein
MAASCSGGSIANVLTLGRRRTRAIVDASLQHVYGAALAAAADSDAAEDVAYDVMIEAADGRARPDARSLVERAVLDAVRTAPHPAFAAMRTEDREAVALARLVGYSVSEVAAALGIAPAEARSRMTNGIRSLAAGVT